MSELLQAAKAVIDDLDNPRVCNVRYKAHQALRAAVERAETVPTEFEEYWITQGFVAEERQTVLTIWSDAQQAERERIKKIIGGLVEQDDPWIHFSTLLEKIDG